MLALPPYRKRKALYNSLLTPVVCSVWHAAAQSIQHASTSLSLVIRAPATAPSQLRLHKVVCNKLRLHLVESVRMRVRTVQCSPAVLVRNVGHDTGIPRAAMAVNRACAVSGQHCVIKPPCCS